MAELRKATPGMFRFTSDRFPACCGTNTVSSFSLEGIYQYMGQPEVDWQNLTPEFIAGMNKVWDSIGQGTMHQGNNLVAITIPFKAGVPDKMYTVVDRVLEATGWIRGMTALGSYGNTQQFWLRPGPKRKIAS